MTQHMSRRNLLRALGMAAGTLAVAACGAAAPSGPPTVAAPAAGSGGDVSLTIESIPAGSRFNTEKLEAKGGSKITLNFKNASTEASKLYNWVLVKPNSVLRVVNRGLEAGEAAGYLQAGDPDVIVATKLIKGGESDTVTFDAPAPGDYPYITTSPGMQAIMKGVLTIK